jgi:hypothetical protein
MILYRFRLNTRKFLKNATTTDWTNTGIHPEWGNLSLRHLLELYADHSERHIGQILELRKLLNKSLDFPLLLEKRLY